METPKLSTMVVLYTTNLKLNTDMLLEKLPINEEIIKIEKRGVLRRGESSRDRIRRRAKTESKPNNTGFGHNSITLVMMSEGDGTLPRKEITIKLFQNGVFHMTGILHESQDRCSLQNLLNLIFEECRECVVSDTPTWEIVQRRVVLMNQTTELLAKTTIPRETLYRTIRDMKDAEIVASYDPDVYPGVKIQFMPSKWTAKVFRTGKIILTGITTHEDCLSLKTNLESLFEKTLV